MAAAYKLLILPAVQLYFIGLYTYPYFCTMSYNRFGGGMDWPPVVKNIIIINVILVLAQFSLIKFNINLQDSLALHYWLSPDFKWWQIVTHIFMHGSPFDVGLTISHIFFNMFGGVLERLWGPRKFILFYLVCGIGAAICQNLVYMWEINSFQNTITHFQQHPGFVEYA
ncbi:MAG: rhomboid family intramembrane serine protease, partial [Chitinophagia bacterium]|nr:rhomboid family intramembrane serine protease [Chitinophagia bacterium]